MLSYRAISPRTRRIVRCASAASACHSVSSDSAPSTSPCQPNNCADGAVARTAAIISGSPTAAAQMRMTRRRVSKGMSSPSPQGGGEQRERRTFILSRICHHRSNRITRPCVAAPGGLHQRWTALIVVIFDLAIQALKAFRSDDLTGRRDRPHWTRPFAQMARTAAFGTALEQIEQMQPIEEREHTTKWTQEAAIGAFGEQADRQ